MLDTIKKCFSTELMFEMEIWQAMGRIHIFPWIIYMRVCVVVLLYLSQIQYHVLRSFKPFLLFKLGYNLIFKVVWLVFYTKE